MAYVIEYLNRSSDDTEEVEASSYVVAPDEGFVYFFDEENEKVLAVKHSLIEKITLREK